jgi:hypothetical protein
MSYAGLAQAAGPRKWTWPPQPSDPESAAGWTARRMLEDDGVNADDGMDYIFLPIGGISTEIVTQVRLVKGGNGVQVHLYPATETGTIGDVAALRYKVSRFPF